MVQDGIGGVTMCAGIKPPPQICSKYDKLRGCHEYTTKSVSRSHVTIATEAFHNPCGQLCPGFNAHQPGQEQPEMHSPTAMTAGTTAKLRIGASLCVYVPAMPYVQANEPFRARYQVSHRPSLLPPWHTHASTKIGSGPKPNAHSPRPKTEPHNHDPRRHVKKCP